jgi:transposase
LRLERVSDLRPAVAARSGRGQDAAITTIETLVPEQLAGIVYQLHTGITWRLLPTHQLGCGSPITCWRRLRDWQRAGVWQQLHQRRLDELGRNGELDRSRASLDSISVRAKRGAA